MTRGELERLAALLEELGEAQQMIGKILRFGYEDWHPDTPGTSNRMLLEEELGHVSYHIELLCAESDIRPSAVRKAAAKKGERFKRYSFHQRELPR